MTRGFKKIVLMAGFAMTMAGAAQAGVQAIQCNYLKDGVYVPSLLIVDEDGTRTRVLIGERGLRGMNMYRTDRVQRWVSALTGEPVDEIAVSLRCAQPVDEDAPLYAETFRGRDGRPTVLVITNELLN